MRESTPDEIAQERETADDCKSAFETAMAVLQMFRNAREYLVNGDWPYRPEYCKCPKCRAIRAMDEFFEGEDARG